MNQPAPWQPGEHYGSLQGVSTVANGLLSLVSWDPWAARPRRLVEVCGDAVEQPDQEVAQLRALGAGEVLEQKLLEL